MFKQVRSFGPYGFRIWYAYFYHQQKSDLSGEK